MSSPRIAIIGGGPIGVEAAALLESKGMGATLFERSTLGASLGRWSHVSFFSTWALNRSSWGADRVTTEVDLDAFPTGGEFVRQYLRPLANSLEKTNIIEGAEVLGVARRDALKNEHIYKPERSAGPFILHILKDGAESYHEADVVIDASGVYGDPGHLGPGGLPALGETAFDPRIERHIPDVLGAKRTDYEGKRTLVAGGGYSAITTVRSLLELKSHAPSTQIVWLLRGDEAPFEVFDNDPLPEREAISKFGNDISAGKVEGVTVVRANAIRSLSPTDGGAIQVELQDSETQKFVVDRVVSNVGYRPSVALSRELQFHTCWASEGPMKLAASLLSGDGGDCLQQSSGGPDLLKNPEPNFFVVGNKSYGRNSAFLLKIGCEQLEQIISLLVD